MAKLGLSHADLTEKIIGSAIYVHQKLGPGLLEAAYERCFSHHLRQRGLSVEQQVPLTLTFDDLLVTRAYKIDMIVENLVLIELKAVEKLAPIHVAQAITYLKFSGLEIGLIFNFNSIILRDGIKRVFTKPAPSP